MAKRMHERFTQGEAVEIYFPQIDRWLAAVVARFDPPGVWVNTVDGRPWFVTNGRRIRPLTESQNSDEGANDA